MGLLQTVNDDEGRISSQLKAKSSVLSLSKYLPPLNKRPDYRIIHALNIHTGKNPNMLVTLFICLTCMKVLPWNFGQSLREKFNLTGTSLSFSHIKRTKIPLILHL